MGPLLLKGVKRVDPLNPKVVSGTALGVLFVLLFMLIASFGPGGGCSDKPAESGAVPEIAAGLEVERRLAKPDPQPTQPDPRLGRRSETETSNAAPGPPTPSGPVRKKDHNHTHEVQPPSGPTPSN